MTDETDIRQLHAEGRYHDAFGCIVDRFQQKLFHLALSITRNEATACDLAQDALLRVWKALPSYNHTASLATWIYTIARNACFTELQRAKRRQAVSLDAPEHMDTLEALAAPVVAEEGASLDIEALLSRLPEKYERVVRLYYLEEKSVEETASLLGIPAGTVKVFLFRARKDLARHATQRSTFNQLANQP